MTEPTLFDFAVGVTTLQAKLLCHKADPDTSRQAAQKMVESGELSGELKMIMEKIKNYDGEDFTALELAGGIKDKRYYLYQKRFSVLERKLKIKHVRYRDYTSPDSYVLRDTEREGHAVWKLL